jgi:preprotein translocase subunit SecE
MNKISQFLKEVRQEVRKVTWPTKAETIRYSAMVVVASLIVAMYLGGVDYVVASLIERFIR